ncbi:tyrosine-type recombinase/integrase [Paraburkholderia caribensis]|uniref:tyrosine-type recombinase/integrase n=1 Tax=Paraburkholderia caribensis TaxID=75105 RepID=UPI00285CCD4A|nr:tyrosine-type recombinase/integrase [Paraburkholderia caribensis]MDR6383989.1 integrase [Paraburkholderia caribensis]
MNARRRTTTSPQLPGRVYPKYGSYHWVRPDKKWIKLCRIEEGEARMLERLAEEKRRFAPALGKGNMPLILGDYMGKHAATYADSFRKEWLRRGKDAQSYFRDWDVMLVDASAVEDFLTVNWPDKLPTQNAMKAWLSKFFSWCVRKRFIRINPCREVSVKKPKARNVYMPHDAFVAIRDALMLSKPHPNTGKRSAVPTGPMMQCFVDLCYLTMQRSTEIRNLRWSVDPTNPYGCSWIDEKAGVIHFVPSKTEDSSGEMVDWPITPEISTVLQRARLLEPAFGQTYVIRDKRGHPKTDQACRDAWEGAMERVGLADAPYTIKDVRAKAMTDAKRLGYEIDQLQIAGAHTDASTTRGYIKSRDVPVSQVRLALPKVGNGTG